MYNVLTAEDALAIVLDVQARTQDTRRSDSQFDLAKALAAAFTQRGRPLACCRRELRCYDPATGVFTVLPDAEVKLLALSVWKGAGHPTGATGNAIVRLVRDISCVPDSFFHDVPPAIALQNGVLLLSDVESSDACSWRHFQIEFRPEFSSEYRCLSRSQVSYQPNGDRTHILDFLEEVLPDKETIGLVCGLVGMALMGDGTRLHRILLLQGEGANGKGVLAELLGALFPPEMRASVPPSELTKDYGVAQLLNKRINAPTECDWLGAKELTALKAVSTGERVQARFVRGNGFPFRPKALQILSTNNRQKLGVRTEALDRRFLSIPFDKVIPRHRQNPDLARTLIAIGLPALLQMCVEAANEIYIRLASFEPPLPTSQAVQTACEELYGECETVTSFLAEEIQTTGNAVRDRIPASEMHARYVARCQQIGGVPLNQMRFKQALAALGHRQEHLDGRKWLGVCWRSDGPEGSEALLD